MMARGVLGRRRDHLNLALKQRMEQSFVSLASQHPPAIHGFAGLSKARLPQRCNRVDASIEVIVIQRDARQPRIDGRLGILRECWIDCAR
jgi:hypothetical protein